MQNHYTPDDESSYSIPNVPGIYKICCLTTGCFYVGSAVNLRRRWIAHRALLRRNGHWNKKLQRAWNKCGEHNFSFEVLEFVLFPELLTDREQHWFTAIKPFGKNGFNIAPKAGSCLGRKLSPESRAKMSAAKKGKVSPSKGRKVSPETRAKQSAAKKGKQPWLGRKHKPESIAKQSAAKKGLKPKLETYAHRMKTIIVTSPTGEEFTVCGIKAFCREHQLTDTCLMRVANGKYKQHKGWTARYPDPEEEAS